MRVRLHEHEFEQFISENEVNAAVTRVAQELNAHYAGQRPLFVGVLNGAFFFATELLKRLTIECEITFVKVASYHGTSSSGKVTDLIGFNERIEGRHIVILEDIVDTGSTIVHILDLLRDRHPASVRIATLLFKPDAYKQQVPIDHVAIRIPNAFVVGSGLDHNGLGRNLTGIYRIIDQPA
ncbi:MAG TPA: hypoxanthine phosphoribosyltransferase [Flavobacteriales bacterium]|nr:hypoxanthine phosphoribosyltransferase [Flavobacteriales bacterium]